MATCDQPVRQASVPPPCLVAAEARRLVYFPPLVFTLLQHERDKGARLTEEEVLGIRDGSLALLLLPSAASKVAQTRGYDDLNPEKCWSEWQCVRDQW